jgi:RNA polymerase sigma-70 factor (ECF subfamily)
MNFQINSERESKLIAAILAGEIHLFHQLIGPYERCIYTLAFSHMRNEEDAQDLAQETFVRALRSLWTFPGDSKFGTWLIQIELSEASTRLRMQTRTHAMSPDESQSEEMSLHPAILPRWQELPSAWLERAEVRTLLRQAVATLPGIHQQVFLLHEVGRLDTGDIAHLLNIAVSSAKASVHRARLMLQSVLAPRLDAIVNGFVSREATRDEDSTCRIFVASSSGEDSAVLWTRPTDPAEQR